MNKTRLMMLVGVVLLSLALVGMALAADNAQKPNPQPQGASTGIAPVGAGVQNIGNSGVNFITPDSFSPAGGTVDLCFNVHVESPDAEYLDGFDFTLPADWVVNSVTDVPGTGCGLGHTFGVNPGNVVYWYTNGMPSGCGDWYYGDYNFCANVTFPAGCSASWQLPWNYYGDTYGSPPHSTSGSELAFCELPGVYLIPDNLQAAGCNGIPQVHTLSLFNNTGSDGTFDMTYAAPVGQATLEGPAQVSAIYGQTVPFEVTLTPNVCNFDQIIATVDTSGNGYSAQATITKDIVNMPTWETIPASSPSWGGTGYPSDGCTAQNSAGEWVTYEIGDTSGTGPVGFWGYNITTNSWFQPGAANIPADRWAPDWAYDPETNMCYMTGGANTPGAGTYNETWAYDPIANTFTQLTSFASVRDFHDSYVGVVDGTKYMCIGGGNNGSGLTSTQCYDLGSGTWAAENATIGPYPIDDWGSADGVLHAATGDQFWFVAGAQSGSAIGDAVYYFDDADNAWHSAGNTGLARYRVEGDFFDGSFYQVAGSDGTFNGTTGVIQGSFDGANWIWTPMPDVNNRKMDNVVALTPEGLWSIDGYGLITPDFVEKAVFCPLCSGPLSVEKTATTMVLPGDPIDYSITINNSSVDEVAASMVDAIPVGTTFVPGSLTCNGGDCTYDAGTNSVLWSGTVGPATKAGGNNNVDSLSGSFVVFDPSVGGNTCSTAGAAQTFCFRAESYTPDYGYVYNLFEKFPADWQVVNAYLQGTPTCDSGSWGSFSWSYQSVPNEININHPRYQSFTDHCVAYYCFDVLTGSTAGLESWYWAGDDYGSPPYHPCSSDIYTPAGFAACDQAINPQAAILPCAAQNPVVINFQATAGETCPAVVNNTAVVSSEGNPDVFATATTNEYCSFAPVIVVNPLSLAAEQPPDTVTTQQLQICNQGPTPLDWSLTEVAGMKVESVTQSPPKQLSAVNKPANVTHDPSIKFNPSKPTSEILLDQEPNQANGVFSDVSCDLCGTAQVLAENFALEDITSLEQIVLWTGYYPGDTPIDPDVIRVLIHQDAAGLPGPVVYDESNIGYNRVQTGVILFGVHEWMHTLTLNTPAILPAGNYWVEIYNDTGFGTDDFLWETGNPDTIGRGLPDAAVAFEAPGVSWFYPMGYGELAMQLIGTIGAPTPPDVLLVNADDDAFGTSPIQGFLQGYGDLGLVDLFNAISATPTLAELQAYDVVVTWSNYTYADATALGDVLADYVDTGGKVIVLNFAMAPYVGTGLGGRFVNENYTPMWGTGLAFSSSCLGTFDAAHPIMGGITDVCETYRESGTYLTPASSEVARWADNELFVAVKDNQTAVAINGYVGVYYLWTGQMDDVLHNAILWLSGGVTPPAGIPWLSEVPTSGTVNPFACTFVDVSFDSTGMAPSVNTGVLDVNSNDPVTPVVPVDVSLTVLAAPDISVTPNFLISTLLPNSQETQNLNVCNNGQSALDWSLAEVPGLKVNSVTPMTAAEPTHPISLALDANGISAPTGPAPATPTGDVSLVLDDGSRDNDIGIGGTQEFMWVNRFTPDPADFPFQINEVWIYFSSAGLVHVGDNIKIVFYENTTGGFDPAPGSNYLGGYVTTVQALDQWNVYTLPDPVWFNGPTGDAIIGAIALTVPGSSYWPASIDQTATQQRSWAGWWNVTPPPDPPLLPPDASWVLIDDYFPGNWMVRGYGTTGADIPWLSEVPTSGTVQPGECTVINVTFDSTGLAPLVYHGGLDITSNDPDTPVFNVPVTLNVIAPVITVDAPSLDVTLYPNQQDAYNMYIGNIGTADLTWAVTDGATWLSEDPVSGTVPPSGETQVVIYFDSTGLTPGVYTTNMVITSNDPVQPEITLPVKLTVIPFVSDLSIVKTATPDMVKVGEMITYTLVVSNAGSQDAAGVVVTDTLPIDFVDFISASAGCNEITGAVTCNVGNLAMGDTITLTITVKAIEAGTATNIAGTFSSSTDPHMANNTSKVDTIIKPAFYYFYLPIIQKH